jgi:4-diphosphocytidyl-2-C-methyl-D-erythritol kinase
MREPVREWAPAKINLTLQVGPPIPAGQVHAGYHMLDSLVAFATDAGDTLAFEPAEHLHLQVCGDFAAGLDGAGQDNLVLKAARLLAAAADVSSGAIIHLEKNLPVASGIGGGSADAAATLRGLMRLWQLSPADVDLGAIAAKLGADVPACLTGRSLRMGGIGTTTTPVDLPALPALLVNPGVACPTPDVYRLFDALLAGGEGEPGALGRALPKPLTPPTVWSLVGRHGNNLEDAAARLLPEIALVLDVLRSERNIRAAAMSGSGATCFGLFDSLDQAARAGQSIQAMLGQALPDLWVKTTLLA